jgi:galactitol PTS system EIIA component
MQYTLVDLLRTEHIRLNLDAKDAQDAIRKLTVPLVETGHVTSGFAEDVLAREQTYPTGLPTRPLAVAIPHADPDHVHRSAICIGILRSPVRFAQMGTDGSVLLDAHLIFLLAIKEQEKQVEMIRQLMTLIQTGSLLEGLMKVGDSNDAIALLQNTLV